MTQRETELDKTPEHRVGMSIYFLRDSIRSLQDLRMANDTADLVLQHDLEIQNCAEWLRGLSEDIHKSLYKTAAE